MKSPKILRLNTEEVLGASWGSLITMLSTIAFFSFVGLFINFSSQLKNSLIIVDCIVSIIFALDTYIDLGRKRTNKPTKYRILFALISIVPTSFLLLIPSLPIKATIVSYIFKAGKGYNLVNRYIQRSNFYRLPRRDMDNKTLYNSGYSSHSGLLMDIHN